MKASAKKLDYQREYRKVNRDRILAYQKAYREKRKSVNPDYMKSYMKQWRNNQKKHDLALTKLMLLYTCDRITIEAVKEILQPLCESMCRITRRNLRYRLLVRSQLDSQASCKTLALFVPDDHLGGA